jgi:hypothetical protein
VNRVWAALLVAGATGCLKAPSIVVVDRGTALEQQASGSFDDVERRLSRAAATPRPAPLTPEQREALGLQRPGAVGGTHLTEADEVDLLLVRHCIGEGADGLLVHTPDACRGVPDPDAIMHAIDSVNRARRQLWRFMNTAREDASLDDVRRAWHEIHVAGVVCGGWIQADDGTWRAKSC